LVASVHDLSRLLMFWHLLANFFGNVPLLCFLSTTKLVTSKL